MNNISPETAYFTRKMNLIKTPQGKERYIIRHLKSLFLNRDMVAFLKDFITQYQGEKRIQMLLYLRKLISQNPVEVEASHYWPFVEEYYAELANDGLITGLDWLDAEIQFVKEVDQPDLILMPVPVPKSQGRNAEKPLPDLSGQKDLLTLPTMLTLLGVGKSTFDRRRKQGLPCFNIGKKIYARKDEFMDWLQRQGNNGKKANIKFSGRK